MVNKEFGDQRDDDLKVVMRAVLEASIWLDNLDNRQKAAEVVGRQAYVNAPAAVIDARLRGQVRPGLRPRREDLHATTTMLFHNDGQVNFPRKSHGIWFMTPVRALRLPEGGCRTTPASPNKLIIPGPLPEVARR